ncbi:MAG TPA: hypothetical protein VFT62_08855 [Mycobacteriales bacterium]|nr:hypothetical protein [Mycobacteriales bacterium]
MPRRSRLLTTLAVSVLGIYVIATIATLVIRVEAHEPLGMSYVIPFSIYALVGCLVATKQPRIPLGWVFLGVGLLTSLGQTSDATVALALHNGWRCAGVVMAAAWVQLWYWYPLISLSTVGTLLLYPNGLPSRRWRPVLWLFIAAVSTITVSGALVSEVDFGKRRLPNPTAVFGAKTIESTPMVSVLNIVFIVLVVMTLASIAIRFRQASGLVRAQMKWFFLAGGLLAFSLVLSLLAPKETNSAVGNALLSIGLTALPTSCGIAVMRYRLYEIDRIVSRTVSYLLVTGSVVGMYVGGVALVDGVLGFSSSVAVAASTLAAAALFQPLRRRLQAMVDRRFDRAAYDARRTVETFAVRLRDQVDVDAIRDDLLHTAATAVAPTRASLWRVAG